MRRTAPILFTVLAASAWMPAPASAAEPKSWEFGGRGNWALVPPASSQPVNNPELDKVEQLLEARRSGEALDRILAWIKAPANLAAPDRDRGLFLLADAYFQDGERIRAFYHLDELLDLYPESRLFHPALEKQYVIADAYLNGLKKKVLGIPLLSVEDEAVDMLFRIQERSPGSPLARQSLLRTADYYFADGQFELAFDAYGAFARAYPRWPDIGTIKLRQALSSLAQFRSMDHDATPLLDARTQFEEVKVRYPELAERAEVQKFVDTINQTLAKKLLVTADFYRRTGKPKAAAYTLLTLVATYPRTPQSDQARAALDKLPKQAVQEAGQVRASEPSTQPIGPPKPAELRPGASGR